MSHLEIVIDAPKRVEYISLQRAIQLRVQRRRRVAKRKYRDVPLFAVEEMQGEFPGYTWEEYAADLTRKTRKGKSFRRPKTKSWDWKMIRACAPDFFQKCKVRTPTKCVLLGRLPNGLEFSVTIRACWYGDYGESRLRTTELVHLVTTATLKQLFNHPATIVHLTNHTFFDHVEYEKHLSDTRMQ